MCAPIRHMYGVLKNSSIPLTACNGDQNAASYANGQLEQTEAMVNLGTGAFVLCHVGEQIPQHPHLLMSITDSTRIQAEYSVEGTVNGAGAALTWVHENWGIDARQHSGWAQIENPPLFINTVGGLGSPWWLTDQMPYFPDQAAEFCVEQPEHCVAAVMESILFMINANLQELRISGCKPDHLLISGGLSSNDAVCQRLANLTGKQIYRSNLTEATARGIAWLAAAKPDSWRQNINPTFAPQSDSALEGRYQRFLSAIKALC